MAADENILLVRLKSIGDILFTLPAVHAVRATFPKARLTFLVSKEFAPLVEGFRDVDAVITLDRASYRGLRVRTMVAETWALLRRLRQGKFSLAIDFQSYGETAFLTWWSGAPRRWGAVYRPGRKWAYTLWAMRDTSLHPADSNLALLKAAGLALPPARNQFVLPQTAQLAGRQLFAQLGLHPTRPTLFIQPFTSAPHKDWPLDRYLATARHWQEHGVQVLFGGGPADIPALEPVRQAGFPVSAGAPLLMTAGLMNLCSLVLGSDTGLLHLAVAMGKRVVMVMASTGPGSCHPYQHKDWAVVPPAGEPVSAITADAVNAACTQPLAEG